MLSSFERILYLLTSKWRKFYFWQSLITLKQRTILLTRPIDDNKKSNEL